ncbi:hypothetical protein [Thalassospira sp. MCCC 1A03138]|uniref:hypothetical protein n=1 Tax=Thalassospira sp. MCCC 1A03138 TaxID=1470576 RepID=UPI00111BD500|nr:hypothetical protein [Thalassospira sp. MCCC 1A03138]
MSTVRKLVEDGQLQKFECELEASALPQRYIYATPEVAQFVEEELGNAQTLYPENSVSPAEQLDDVFHQYCSGGSITVAGACYWMGANKRHDNLKELRIAPKDVWEFKTTDLRIFGWFHEVNIFIVTNIKMKSTLEQLREERDLDLYPGLCEEAVTKRTRLGLEPKKRPTYLEIVNGLQN